MPFLLLRLLLTRSNSSFFLDRLYSYSRSSGDCRHYIPVRVTLDFNSFIPSQLQVDILFIFREDFYNDLIFLVYQKSFRFQFSSLYRDIFVTA